MRCLGRTVAKLLLRAGGVQIKIEVTPVIQPTRGPFPFLVGS
jgi:hypothetical protein